jgi:tetratricopeptide (TPR) repeat protein
MVRRLSLLSYLVAGVAMLPLSAVSAADVTARANTMDDYTRIVLDFEKTPSYIADQKSSSLKLTFQNESDLSSAAKSITSAPRVASVLANDKKNIQFTFSNPKEIRHFTIGNRVIIDVYGDQTTADQKTPEQKIEDKPVTATASEEKKADETKLAVKEDIKTETPEPKIDKGAALMTIESITDIQLAVYQSGSLLNIVVNQPNFAPAPQITGDKSIIEKTGNVDIKNFLNATMFGVKIPSGTVARAEGGGKKWRIILSSSDKNESSPISLSRAGEQLVWAVPNTGAPLTVTDPESGDDVKLIPVSTAQSFTGASQNFVDMKLLPSQVGMAFVPKRDNVNVTTKPDKVIIGDGQSLSISSKINPTKTETLPPKDEPKSKDDQAPKTEAELTAGETLPTEGDEASKQKPVAVTDTTRYFDLAKWQQGGIKKLESNRQNLLNDFLKKPIAQQADTLISLVKLEIANGMGAEARGYLDYATALVPELEPTPTVMALSGAVETLMGHDDDAFALFTNEKLANNAEIQMWRAVSLARLEDWAQAGENMPAYPVVLETYPPVTQIPLGLTLAEIALRNGNPRDADKILELISKQDKSMSDADHAAMAYLRGESDRQKGKVAEAKKFWEPLATGTDDLYRVKAGLSLTNLQLDKKEITPDEAIDRLEGFRYTWRGDELETAVNFRLGRLYIEKGDAVKGLNTLRQAASLSPQSEQATQITELMKTTFKDLFLTEKINDISPVDAVTVYEEFTELTPADDEGSQILEKLSSRLVDVDLLPRAAAMLQKKIDQGATGLNGAETAARLADILVMDKNADKAIEALNKADELLKDVPVDQSAKVKKQMAMLRAQAYGIQKKPDQAYEALSLLAQDEDVLRLRADIAWDNERWQDSADALEALVQKSDLSPSRPVTDDQAELLLNWAIALHKAENKFVLADIRDRFSTAMAASPYNEKFEIVTRSKQNSVVVDRASIDQIISEVDMFKKAGENVTKTEPAVGVPTDAEKAAVSAESNATPEEPAVDQGEADVAGADGAAGNEGSNTSAP